MSTQHRSTTNKPTTQMMSNVVMATMTSQCCHDVMLLLLWIVLYRAAVAEYGTVAVTLQQSCLRCRGLVM